jgi:hypothetical protein
MHERIRSLVAAGAVLALLTGTTAAAAGLSGAIFTTDANGNWVNGNVYDSKEAVYLNGGPRANQDCTAAGLPNGWYIFLVTDPSGQMVLSWPDEADRLFEVEDGVIKTYSGSHTSNSNGRCGGRLVALAPFDDTLNPGGEYKVWVTPYDPTDGSYEFIPSQSKTDNFKVQAPDGDGD